MLAFKPGVFFYELSKVSHYKRKQIEAAYYLAKREKLFEISKNEIKITEIGRKIIRPYMAQRLSKRTRLLVVFDIPEDIAVIRARLRRILRQWHFQQIQKSVWVTDFDHEDSIKALILELDIEPYVQLYECSRL